MPVQVHHRRLAGVQDGLRREGRGKSLDTVAESVTTLTKWPPGRRRALRQLPGRIQQTLNLGAVSSPPARPANLTAVIFLQYREYMTPILSRRQCCCCATLRPEVGLEPR